MRAYHLIAPHPDIETGIAALARIDIETPRPRSGEVLVRQRAASLNYVDLLYVTGAYVPPCLPLIPVMDGAGEIIELGDGVEDFRVGDRVVPHMLPEWLSGPLPEFGSLRARGYALPGSLAEFAAVPAASLARIPAHLSFEEAATLPTAGTTAWNAIRNGDVRPGATVLILGTGGVSLFALQFAKAFGARVIVTSSSDEKLERARAIGADATINYSVDTEWDVRVREMTDGLGVDLVVETVGEATFTRSVNSAAREGRIAAAGWRSGTIVSMPINRVQQQGLRIYGGVVGSVADFRDMVRGLSGAGVRPVVDGIFRFDDACDAYRALARGDRFGKTVIKV